MTAQAFTKERGIAAPLPAANIDTDIIMPKQFLKTITRENLGDGAFHDLRFNINGTKNPDFVLNKPPYDRAKFLIVGPNFGCGSSREHAVWGILQLGIRAIVGSSFAGIFADNASKNGLLLVALPPAETSILCDQVTCPDCAVLEIDLADQQIYCSGNRTIPFDISPHNKTLLLEGRDHIDLTLAHADDIRAFEAQRLARQSVFAAPSETA